MASSQSRAGNTRESRGKVHDHDFGIGCGAVGFRVNPGWLAYPACAYPSCAWEVTWFVTQAEKPETVGQGLGGIEGWRWFKDVVMARLICSDLYDFEQFLSKGGSTHIFHSNIGFFWFFSHEYAILNASDLVCCVFHVYTLLTPFCDINQKWTQKENDVSFI